jgi:hypothetical protein
MERVIGHAASAALVVGCIFLTTSCGSEDADEAAAEPSIEAPAAHQPSLPVLGTARVEIANGRVSVLSNGAQRLAILQRLADEVGFDLDVGDLEPLALTLRIEDAALGEALVTLLAGVRYRLEYDFDAAVGSNVLVWLAVGEPVSVGEPAAVGGVPLSESEPRRPDADVAPHLDAPAVRDLIEQQRARLAAMSPEERRRLRERSAARADAMEPEFLEQLEDLDPRVRAEAVSELPLEGEGAKGAERFERMASLLGEDPDRRVRAAAAERIGEIESPEAVHSLALALSDPDREVVLAAIRALEDIDHVSAVPHLQSLLQDPDPEVREAAEFAIEYIQW